MPVRMETRMIPVNQIHPNPDNPRHEAGNVSGLGRSINEEELLQPILVIPAPHFGGDHFMIEDGYRRWVAGKEVRRSLLCQIRYPAPEENRAMRAIFTGLVTDAHKEQLSALERGDAYRRLLNEFGLSRAQIAKQTGFTIATIDRYLSLTELSDKNRDQIKSGKLTVEKAVAAVKEHHQKNRKKEGKAPIDVGWEPDSFSTSHPLAKKAKVMCEARHDKSRRRFAGGCHACWEVVIRQDQSRIDSVDYGSSGLDVPFVAPSLMPISADGAIRTDATPNGIRRGV